MVTARTPASLATKGLDSGSRNTQGQSAAIRSVVSKDGPHPIPCRQRTGDSSGPWFSGASAPTRRQGAWAEGFQLAESGAIGLRPGSNQATELRLVHFCLFMVGWLGAGQLRMRYALAARRGVSTTSARRGGRVACRTIHFACLINYCSGPSAFSSVGTPETTSNMF